jgi:uncharacterized protein YfaS (alpha-2-macroglobulin family)
VTRLTCIFWLVLLGSGTSLGASWQNVDALIKDDKPQAALQEVEKLIAAKPTGDAAVKAYVYRAKLQSDLGRIETAVIDWQKITPPKTTRERALLSLHAARLWQNYLVANGYQIDQREATTGNKAVEKLTRAQIAAEIAKEFAVAWEARSELGGALKDWGQYVKANDYPAGIRDRQRDALTYFLTEFLADSTNWTPGEQNRVYELPLDKLGGDADDVPTAKVADKSQHPILRAAAALADLEEWHDDADRDGAAIEARVARLTLLRDAFSQQDSQAKIRQQLVEYLDDHEDDPWWAAGMAVLAGWDLADDNHKAAHAAAAAGFKRYPTSVGGKQCNAIKAQLERRQFEVEAMASDGEGRQSIRVEHRNMTRLYWRAYEVSLTAMVSERRLENQVRTALKKKPVTAWETALKDLGDFQDHRTFVTPPLNKKGFYLIIASDVEAIQPDASNVQALYFNVTNLAITSETRGAQFAVTVFNAVHGAPVKDAEVQLYRVRDGGEPKPDAQLRTDLEGQAVHTIKQEYVEYYVVARHGSDVVLDRQPRYVYANRQVHGESRNEAFIFTDRSVYRPGQKIHWKVIAYSGSSKTANFRTDAGRALKVQLRDAGGQSVRSEDAKANKFGTASGTFVIPEGRPLGRWSMQVGNSYGASFLVEEYKRPTFEVAVSDPSEPLRLNRPSKLGGTARYYFGQPVTSGRVTWRVTRERQYPWWWHYWGGDGNSGSEPVADGTAKLDDDGKFDVEFKPSADEAEASSGVTYQYRLAVDVTDDGGETRSAERSFAIGFSAVTATLLLADGFVSGGAATFSVRRTDLNGTPRAGNGQWRLVSLKQPKAAKMPSELPKSEPPAYLRLPKAKKSAKERLPGDDQTPRWESDYDQRRQLSRWDDGESVDDGAVTHGKDGEAKIALKGLAPGAYRLRYETSDEFGAEQSTWQDFVVASKSGKGLPLALPAYMQIQDGSVPVGKTARVLIHTALRKQTAVLDIYRDGILQDRRVLRGENIGVVEIPITASMRGGLGLRLTVVHDHQRLVITDRVSVPWDDRDIKLSFERFRDRITPGGRETWRVKVAGVSGAKAAEGLELLAYMYDRSLDLFAPHVAPDPRSLLPDRTDMPWPGSSVDATSGQVPWRIKRDALPSAPQLRDDEFQHLPSYSGRRHGRGMYLGGGVRAKRAQAEFEGMESMAMDEAAPSEAPMALAAPSPTKAEENNKASGVSLSRLSQSMDAPEPAAPPRENFAETAFFNPHVLVDAKGEAALEFTVPDAVTSWTVWVHAIKRDLSAGSASRETRTAKELLVRPYLSRFLREGDESAWRVMVNNDSGKPLSGNVELSLTDPDTGADLAAEFGVKATSKPFKVATGKSATVTFTLDVPSRVKPIVVTVKGASGGLSDGEKHLIPVLPSLVRVSESKFTFLDKPGKETLAFKAPVGDKSFKTEQFIATVDGQLFYGALNALPYLIDYPYECVEQTLNRFVSTGIMAGLFKRYPAVAAAAKSMQARNTQWEPWDAGDPNLRMQLEETPWLAVSKGGQTHDLVKVLDPRLVEAERKSSLAKLKRARNQDGGLPWFPGGKSSPYITIYTLLGLAKAQEFGVKAPDDLVGDAWRYLGSYFRTDLKDEIAKGAKGCCVESLVLLNYVATALPSSALDKAFSKKDREAVLSYTYDQRKRLSLYLKSFLALTLHRMGRQPDAVNLMASVMDAARTDKNLGTYWAPEERSWIWYNDHIESHAWALRALQEITPKSASIPGLVRWLFVNKKLSHWKSTRATAEAIYALAHYMDGEKLLTASESLKVSAAGKSATFTYAPDKFVGKNQLRLSGKELGDAKAPAVTFEKSTKAPMLASATWHYATSVPPKEDRGDLLAVSRRYFKRALEKGEPVLTPLKPGDVVAIGDEIEVQLTMRASAAAEYVHLRDPRPAGFEPVQLTSGHRWDTGISRYEEVRDSGLNLFFEWVPKGEYVMRHRLRAAGGGRFRIAPAQLQSLYAPEFTAYTAGAEVEVAAQ